MLYALHLITMLSIRLRFSSPYLAAALQVYRFEGCGTRWSNDGTKREGHWSNGEMLSGTMLSVDYHGWYHFRSRTFLMCVNKSQGLLGQLKHDTGVLEHILGYLACTTEAEVRAYAGVQMEPSRDATSRSVESTPAAPEAAQEDLAA